LLWKLMSGRRRLRESVGRRIGTLRSTGNRRYLPKIALSLEDLTIPPDPDCRFEVELREHEEKKTMGMAYTEGEERDFIRWGEFRFRIGGEQCGLQAYRSDSEEEQLFIPFRDATSGCFPTRHRWRLGNRCAGKS